MAEQKDEWWVSREGHQFGPVTFAEVVEAAKAGRLEPRTDMLFSADLADWVPAGDVDGVFERNSPSPLAEETGEPRIPGEDKLSDSGDFDFSQRGAEKLRLPGATRLGWFLGTTVLPAALFAGIALAVPQVSPLLGKGNESFAALLMLIPVIVILVVTVKRFQNLGMSGWWLLGFLFVPFLNIWLQYRLFACPPGYIYTKRLDTVGKVLAVLYWLLFLGALAIGVLGLMTGGMAAFKEASENGELRKLRNQWEEIKDAAEKKQAPPTTAPTQ